MAISSITGRVEIISCVVFLLTSICIGGVAFAEDSRSPLVPALVQTKLDALKACSAETSNLSLKETKVPLISLCGFTVDANYLALAHVKACLANSPFRIRS